MYLFPRFFRGFRSDKQNFRWVRFLVVIQLCNGQLQVSLTFQSTSLLIRPATAIVAKVLRAVAGGSLPFCRRNGKKVSLN
jgi:hypothetical protein